VGYTNFLSLSELPSLSSTIEDSSRLPLAVKSSALAILLRYYRGTSYIQTDIDKARTDEHNFTVYLAWLAIKHLPGSSPEDLYLNSLIKWTVLAFTPEQRGHTCYSTFNQKQEMKAGTRA
jgi:hypothetical protein